MKLSVLYLLAGAITLFLSGCGGSPQVSSPAPSIPTSIATSTPSAPSNPSPAPANPAPGPAPDPPSPGATMQCPAGQFDMLDWATLDPDLAADHHLEGNANPLYTYIDKDKFYWMKGASGYPWDIQLVDDKNIYLWVTEQVWGDPDTFKKSHRNTNMPLISRCAQGGQPGSSVKSDDTSFEIVHKCDKGDVSDLGSMVNEVWGPDKMSFGGDIPDDTDTLIVTYRYDCDRKYKQCNDREQFYLTQRYGLVRWDHSKWKNGAYVQDNFTVYNKLVHGGAPAPYFPCQ